ncbi:MAG: ATP-binding cassette domain-containing protein [Jiangellales bacterium]
MSLAIEPGELFALLGPNGSGKTTTIGMLCCLLRPDEGSAQILGRDVTGDPMGVKSVISVVPQDTAVAEHLNGWENLRLMAGLHGIPAERARVRSGELLEVLGLRAKADKQARTYSGGLKRRLSIAMGLVSDPQVLFLDEPTLGLDPQARRGMWEHIASLKGEVTILLTTHYLEEADALADRVAIIDAGRIVAQGSPDELKAGVSAGLVTLVVADDVGEAALQALRAVYPQSVAVEAGVEITGDDVDLLQVQQVLRPHDVTIESIGRKQTSLDDVFLTLTGKQWRE